MQERNHLREVGRYGGGELCTQERRWKMWYVGIES